MKGRDVAKRSLTKTITYRLLIIVSTYCISLVITKDPKVSLGITSVASVANTLLYYFHERFWSGIKWGRR